MTPKNTEATVETSTSDIMSFLRNMEASRIQNFNALDTKIQKFSELETKFDDLSSKFQSQEQKLEKSIKAGSKGIQDSVNHLTNEFESFKQETSQFATEFKALQGSVKNIQASVADTTAKVKGFEQALDKFVTREQLKEEVEKTKAKAGHKDTVEAIMSDWGWKEYLLATVGTIGVAGGCGVVAKNVHGFFTGPATQPTALPSFTSNPLEQK